jgi:DNA invertase Pin-like site-specific DNA recombinase
LPENNSAPAGLSSGKEIDTLQIVRAIATYRRVSTEEQARNTDAYERQLWQLNCELAKYPDREHLIFEDIQSGKRDDRPDMLKLIAAIDAGRVEILIVTRIDRIGRDLEANARLQKLLERKGVKVYETLLDRFLDWQNPNDWSYFSNAGLDSEKESRMLSARVKKTFDWHRSQGKMGGGRVGFPYKRSDDGYIIPDPYNWALAIACIKIVTEENGATMQALARIRDLGLDRSRIWLSQWIRSPLLRGHTPQLTRDSDRNKKHVSKFNVVRNTHPSLFADPRLDGRERQIDRIIEDAKRIKGSTTLRAVYPLSGLLYCGRCGSPAHIKRISSSAYPNKQYTYVMCGQRQDRGKDCGGAYGAHKGHRKSVNATYADVEAVVIDKLVSAAAGLVDLSIADRPIPQENPIIAELRAKIAQLKSLDDPDLDPAIAKKTDQLNKLLLANTDASISAQLRQEFIDLFSQPEVFTTLTDTEKRTLYRDWVRKITVDRREVNVILAI